MKIKEGGGEYQRNTRTTARRITRSHDIVSFVSYMRHSISLDIPESTFIKESSKVRRPFRLHLASPLINASGWPLETRQLAIGLLHPQLRIERFDRIHDTLSIPFPFRNETKRNTPIHAICLASIRFRVSIHSDRHNAEPQDAEYCTRDERGGGWRSARVDGGGSRFDCAPPLVGGERMRELNQFPEQKLAAGFQG